MNGFALLGILVILYGLFVAWVAHNKPAGIWKMAKIQLFIRFLGEKGTVYLFYILATLCILGGRWIMVR
ncbi:MAG: hypothetical protein Q8N36_05085 [bacterium]|nr:hypothetical protein [bacterium]